MTLFVNTQTGDGRHCTMSNGSIHRLRKNNFVIIIFPPGLASPVKDKKLTLKKEGID